MYGVYAAHFLRGIATLTLAMTKFNCLCERSEAGSTARPPFVALTRATSPVSSGESTPGRVEVYGVYAPYFFRGIAAALRASQ